MGLFDRVEKGLERAVNGAFAKAFRAELQPVEIAAAIRRRMDDRAALLDRGRTMVPNIYTVELSPGDYDRLADFETSLTEELVAAAQEHAETQRYQPSGPLAVQFAESDTLKTGTFRVTSANSRRSYQPSAGSMPSRRSTPSGPYAEPDSAVRPAPSAPAQQAPAAPEPGPAPVVPVPVPAPPVVPAPVPVPLPEPVPTAAADPGFDPLADDPFAPTSRQPGPPQRSEQHQEQRQEQHPQEAQPIDARPEAPAVVIPTSSASRPAPHRTPAPSTAGAMARPWLEIDGERYPLISAMTVLGRDESCDVLIEDPGVSRRHCEFRVTTDGPHIVCSLRDLGSTNGTFVNSERITSQRLEPGDRVTVGRTSFTYRAGRR